MVKGFIVAKTCVPVPRSKPAGPYSTIHCVAPTVSVQSTVMLLSVVLTVCRLCGRPQGEAGWTRRSST